MMRSLKFGHWVALLCMVAVVVGCGETRESAWDTTTQAGAVDEATKARVADLPRVVQPSGRLQGFDSVKD